MLVSPDQEPFPMTARGEKFEKIMKTIWNALLFVSWVAGIVIAEGGMKIIALLIPFYAWYLLLERIMKLYGLI